MTVYGVCIFVANEILLAKFKTHYWFGIFMLTWGPIAYFLFYWMLNLIFTGDIKALFKPNYTINIVWLGFLFILTTVWAIEKGLDTFNRFQADQIKGDLCWCVESCFGGKKKEDGEYERFVKNPKKQNRSNS